MKPGARDANVTAISGPSLAAIVLTIPVSAICPHRRWEIDTIKTMYFDYTHFSCANAALSSFALLLSKLLK